MKIALCFGGQPRSPVASYDTVVKNLIIPNNIEDIFIHTWYRPEFASVAQGQNGKGGIMPESNLTFIRDNYKPKKMVVQNDNQIKFHSHDVIRQNCPKAVRLEDLLPAWYSRLSVNCLKNEYKSQIGLDKYDAVIFLRFDTHILKEIKIDQLDLNAINTYYVVWKSDFPENERHKYVGDIINVSNEKNMDIYAEVYNNLIEISKHIEYMFGESVLGQHLLMNNVPFVEPWKYHVNVNIVR